MNYKLQYGEPPAEEDCVDIGVVPENVAPVKLTNEFIGRNTEFYNLVGAEIPPVRRAWLTVAHYRYADVPLPYKVKIPGLGTLLYDKDEWESDCWAVVK